MNQYSSIKQNHGWLKSFLKHEWYDTSRNGLNRVSSLLSFVMFYYGCYFTSLYLKSKHSPSHLHFNQYDFHKYKELRFTFPALISYWSCTWSSKVGQASNSIFCHKNTRWKIGFTWSVKNHRKSKISKMYKSCNREVKCTHPTKKERGIDWELLPEKGNCEPFSCNKWSFLIRNCNPVRAFAWKIK